METIRNKTYSLLRTSEKYLKTDMVYLAKGSFWLTSGQFFTSGASFLLALLFARLVPKEVYGNYRYVLSLAGLVATFSLTGISTGVLQSVARGFYGTFIEAVKISTRWNSLMLITALCGAGYYLFNDNTTLGYSLLVVAFLFPAIKTFEIYEAFVNGTKNFRASALLRGSVDIMTIIATGVGIMLHFGVIGLITINLLTQVALNALFFRKIYSSISPDDRKKVEPLVMNFSKHLSFQNVLTNFASYFDKIIIFHFLGAAEVAIYAFATAIPQQIRGFIVPFAVLATPKIANRPIEESVRMIPQRFFVSWSVILPIVILYIAFAPFLLQLFFPAYIESAPYTRWYALTLLLLGNTSDLILTTKKAVKEKYILNIFASVSLISLMLILGNLYKIHGIVLAVVISKTLNVIVAYILVRRFAKLNPGK